MSIDSTDNVIFIDNYRHRHMMTAPASKFRLLRIRWSAGWCHVDDRDTKMSLIRPTIMRTEIS